MAYHCVSVDVSQPLLGLSIVEGLHEIATVETACKEQHIMLFMVPLFRVLDPSDVNLFQYLLTLDRCVVGIVCEEPSSLPFACAQYVFIYHISLQISGSNEVPIDIMYSVGDYENFSGKTAKLAASGVPFPEAIRTHSK